MGNMIYLYITPSGSVNLIEGDKMPVKDFPSFWQKAMAEYERKLQAAIDSSIPCSDQDFAKELIEQYLFSRRKELHFIEIESLKPYPGVFYGPLNVDYKLMEDPIDEKTSREVAKLIGDNIEGRETEVQMLSMEFRKTMFDSAYEYLRKQGTHARPDITKHDFLCGYLQCHNDHFKPVGKLEEKEIKPGEPFTVDGRRYVIVNTSSASESSNLENGQNIFILKSVGTL